MRTIVKVAAAAVGAAILAGCVASTAVPLSRDVWRLQVTVDGPGNTALVEERVLREAAALAFRNGATHFLIEDAPPQDAVEEAARAILYGDTRLFIVGPGANTRSGYAATALVVLLGEDDPRAARAFRTLDVIGG